MPSSRHAAVHTSKIKKTLLTIISVPFLLLCMVCAIFVIYALFHLGEDGAFVSLLVFLLIGGILGFIGVALLTAAMEPQKSRAVKTAAVSPRIQPYPVPANVVTPAPKVDADYIVLDLETTGFSPHTCSIIDIGIVFVKNDCPILTYSQLINPGTPLPPEIITLTGVTDQMLIGQPRIENVLKIVRDAISNYPILGHNIEFDISFLNAALAANELPPLTNPLLDTQELSYEVFPTATRHTLQDVMRRVGITTIEKHRALADAQDTLECYRRLNAFTIPQKVSEEDERISAVQASRKTKAVFRSRYIGANEPEPVNSKPYGIRIQADGGVEIVGEETHQQKLSEYGLGTWIWVTLERGINPRGTHAGEPTITVTLDGEQIGYTTPINTSRHYHQVPSVGGVALAHVKAGGKDKSKLDIRIEMPYAEEPSAEYLDALEQSKVTKQKPRHPDTHPTTQTPHTPTPHTNVESEYLPSNKMPHKKELSGSREVKVILNESAAEHLDAYPDETVLWAILRKVISGEVGTISVVIGRQKLGILDTADSGSYSDLITDNGAMTKIKLTRLEGERISLVAMMPGV